MNSKFGRYKDEMPFDMLPFDLWPPDWEDLADPKREFACHNPRMPGTEIRTTSSQVAITATRIS